MSQLQFRFNLRYAGMHIDALKRFIRLNLGNWTGSFHVGCTSSNLHQAIQLLNLIMKPNGQSTKSKKPTCLLQKNINSLQIGFFPQEKAFALRYQTAGMLETVLRERVLGEDDIGEASPKNLKLPSKLPSIVCENCLYSLDKDLRARAFHIMDPKGIVEMLILFLEQKGAVVVTPHFLDESKKKESRITQHLGTWKGRSITKRSGVYGATDSEADTGQLIQDDCALIEDDASAKSMLEVSDEEEEDNKVERFYMLVGHKTN